MRELVRDWKRLGMLGLLGLFGLTGCGGDTPTDPGEQIREFADHREVDVTFQNAGATLAGTIFLPLGPGPHPGIAIHFGSGAWTRGTFESLGVFVVEFGMAVLTYDKRGVGESEGGCCPEDFQLLAADFAAGAGVLRNRPEVDRGRVGFMGSSQGAWIVPIAAAQQGDEVLFVIEAVGGVVSVGEQNVFQRMTGLETCTPSGTPAAEIETAMDAARHVGFDPLPHLGAMTAPTLWIFGENDASTPTARSVARLDSLRTAWGKDWTWEVFEDANHDLIVGGSICQTEGEQPDFLTPLRAWLERVMGG